MLNRIGSYPFTIDAYLSDFRGKATLPMIGGYLLQGASKHAEERGFGYSDMSAKGMAWVLSRMHIQMLKYPSSETQIKVCTWVTSVNKLFTERCFSIEDQDGCEIGFARSLWAALDLKTRKASNILELNGLTDYISAKECPIDAVSKITSPKTEGQLLNTFKVQYSDIDINKHLNSMKYIEHFVDVFPIEMHLEKEINDFHINYLFESQYGEQINIAQEVVEPDIFILSMSNTKKAVCLAKVGWKKQQSGGLNFT